MTQMPITVASHGIGTSGRGTNRLRMARQKVTPPAAIATQKVNGRRQKSRSPATISDAPARMAVALTGCGPSPGTAISKPPRTARLKERDQ